MLASSKDRSSGSIFRPDIVGLLEVLRNCAADLSCRLYACIRYFCLCAFHFRGTGISGVPQGRGEGAPGAATPPAGISVGFDRFSASVVTSSDMM